MSRSNCILGAICALVCASVMCSTAEALDYSHLELNGVNCPRRDSCRSNRNTTFDDRNCECDRICNEYRDCCIDANYRREMVPISQYRWTCMPFGGDPNKGAYIISRCPRNFNGPESLRRRCEGPKNMSDPSTYAVPMTDTSFNITYRNLHCAACNNVLPERLSSWRVFLDCPSLKQNVNINDSYVTDNLNYTQGNWGVHYNGRFHKCKLEFNNVSNVQLCRARVISRCPNNWNRAEVRRNCESYMAIAYDRNRDHVFRNPDCAMCNGVSLSNITCDPAGLTSRNRKKPLSFALLLDINPSDGDQVGRTRITPYCADGEKYDPFFKKCRKLVCALPGYTIVGDECVRG